MSTTARVVCPTLHVERLDDDRVWMTLRRSLERLSKSCGHATAFVSTGHARREQRELGGRLRWIADQGHEIAMHTHFRRLHRPDLTEAAMSHSPLTDEDIVASLQADYAYLVDRGHVPRGFCAGRWSIYPATTEWLSTHGFHYDCSFRSYALKYDNPSAVAGDSHKELSTVNGILEVPTTATLRTMLVRPTMQRCPSLPYEGGTYALYYLHDWDLLARRKEVAFGLLARRLRNSSVVPVCELVRAFGE
jgi:peptidoglycan/xylan/chitin deacetylase (PgdA/CDA1 family)